MEAENDAEDDEDSASSETKRELNRSRPGSTAKPISIIKNKDLVRNTSSNNSRRHLNEDVLLVKNRKASAKSHSSNLISRGASNCGEAQRERKDPFDLKEANYSFYEEFNKLDVIAKKHIVKYDFEQPLANPNRKQIVLQSSFDAKSSGEHDNNSPVRVIAAESGSSSQNKISILNADASLYRMAHSENRNAHISNFNSWSLVSIGKYSDYNVHTGLTQPGFLQNK